MTRWSTASRWPSSLSREEDSDIFIPSNAPLSSRVRLLERHYDEAAAYYQSSNNAQALIAVRQQACWRMGYHLALEPDPKRRREPYDDAAKLLKRMAQEFREVSWNPDSSASLERLATLIAFAEAGGQSYLFYCDADCEQRQRAAQILAELSAP